MSETRLRALLALSRYAKLFAAVRARMETAGRQARSVRLEDLGTDERIALAELLGWGTVPGASVRLQLSQLDRALRESAAAASLDEVLAALGGPLVDRRAAREERRAALAKLWAGGRARVEAAGRTAELGGWLERLRASGALLRAARAAGRDPTALLDESLRVAFALPAGGRLLAVLATEVTGDPHALDPGAPLAPLALRAAAALAGWSSFPANAAERRRLWREVGVDCDPLSAQVLVLGLRPRGEGLLARHLRESAAEGEPRRVTLRELQRGPIELAPGTDVFVCENPAVIAAAADVHGSRTAALVCVEGVPSTAAMELLRSLAGAGARIHVRADFDWAGLRIAGQVMAATGGTPWRFRAEDYERVLSDGGAELRLSGSAAPSPWDPRLAQLMAATKRAVPEESVLDALLADTDLLARMN